MPGGAFNTQETEDMAAWQTDGVDAALQADGTLRGHSSGGGGTTARVLSCFFFQLGWSWSIHRGVHFPRTGHPAERNRLYNMQLNLSFLFELIATHEAG